MLRTSGALALLMLFVYHISKAQELPKEVKDSLFIEEVENRLSPDKVLHAEPLFIDLIRDLGARKGEREWNVGVGLTDRTDYDEYEALIEYEWAPVNRLGLEVELPFTFYYPSATNGSAPGNKLNSVKFAAQYSFFVSEPLQTSMAVGYLHEFELNEFENYRKSTVFTGITYNPFFVVAKRWGNNFHSLLYTGPVISSEFQSQETESLWKFNTSLHYMISGTRNFIGVEVNQSLEHGNLETVLRPQMRVGIADNLMIGIVTGIPIEKNRERLSSFIRLIYEPRHH